jgi:hypothetical protein
MQMEAVWRVPLHGGSYRDVDRRLGLRQPPGYARCG